MAVLSEDDKGLIWYLARYQGRKFTQDKLAKLFGVSQTTIQRVIKEGDYKAEIARLKRLADDRGLLGYDGD